MKLRTEKIGTCFVSHVSDKKFRKRGKRERVQKDVVEGVCLYPTSHRDEDLDFVKSFMAVLDFLDWYQSSVEITQNQTPETSVLCLEIDVDHVRVRRDDDVSKTPRPHIWRLIPDYRMIPADMGASPDFVYFEWDDGQVGITITPHGRFVDGETQKKLIDLGFEVVEEGEST